MIIGVTHDHDGRVIQRLSVSTKVSIGLPPNGDRNHPTNLDHFVFLRKKKSANRVGWEVDPELTEHYGEECRELHIMLIDDDIENVFPSSYAWWTATERKCWGDGTSATRRTAEKPGGQPWTQCGSGCPELSSGQRKPGGDLRFVLADYLAPSENVLKFVSWQFRNSKRHVCFGLLADWYRRLLDTEVFDWKCHQYRPFRTALSGSTYPAQVSASALA